MADKTKQQTSHRTLDSLMEFEDHELQSTMREFLEDEQKKNPKIWNFATIAGIAMFFVGVVYLVQTIIPAIGPDLSGLVEWMPLIGGVLVTLVGFGFLVGERPNRKKSSRKSGSKQRFDFNFDFEDDEDEEFSLENHLNTGSSKSKTKSGSKKRNFNSYALHQSKKLYKSRTDKKWAGVCGGLARYFGISSTVIRLLFIVTFFAGSGASLLVYLALAIALDKEPPELMDDFDF